MKRYAVHPRFPKADRLKRQTVACTNHTGNPDISFLDALIPAETDWGAASAMNGYPHAGVEVWSLAPGFAAGRIIWAEALFVTYRVRVRTP